MREIRRLLSSSLVIAAAVILIASMLTTKIEADASAITISSPIIVSTHEQIINETSADGRVDGSFSTFMCDNTRYSLVPIWDHINGGIPHVKMQATLDNPFSSKISHKRRPELFGTVDATKGIFWIVNTYQTSEGILGFVHVEQAEGGPGPGKSRVGLAWSTDCGDTFTYLGEIIKPNDDTDAHNIQGVPYITKDGYFYAYFHDAPGYITIARAPINDVITAAKAGTVSPWQKYHNGDFTSDALGGPSSSLGILGISHTDAAYSTHTGKYYLIVSRMNWNGEDTWVKLFESSDAIQWTEVKTLIRQKPTEVQQPIGGYQYCTITPTDEEVDDNSVVDDTFYVYCNKEAKEFDKNTLYRWTVHLDKPTDFYRYSIDFSSIQGGGGWNYLYSSDGNDDNMTWDATKNYWVASNTFPQIWRSGGHPAENTKTVFKWTAPQTGTINTFGTAYDTDGTCGDGVQAEILKDGTMLWQGDISNDHTVGESHNVSIDVTLGEEVLFQIDPKQNAFCDSTGWDPTIIYTSVTPDTSPSPSPACASADINLDGAVNIADYSLLAADFLESTPATARSDINQDGSVNIADYTLLVAHFLESTVTCL